MVLSEFNCEVSSATCVVSDIKLIESDPVIESDLISMESDCSFICAVTDILSAIQTAIDKRYVAGFNNNLNTIFVAKIFHKVISKNFKRKLKTK